MLFMYQLKPHNLTIFYEKSIFNDCSHAWMYECFRTENR